MNQPTRFLIMDAYAGMQCFPAFLFTGLLWNSKPQGYPDFVAKVDWLMQQGILFHYEWDHHTERVDFHCLESEVTYVSFYLCFNDPADAAIFRLFHDDALL